jgi:Spy/CpxP family protein refolding chaperone
MRLGILATALAAGALLAGAAAAQPPGGGPGGFGGGLAGMIAQSKQLQDELKVDKEQIEKLSAALTKAREDMRDESAKLRDRNLSPEDRAEIMKKIGDANAKAVDSVLKPDQVKRLHQIENQQAGVGMFNKEDVQKSLKLTDTQKDKIKSINEDLQKEMRDLFAGGFGSGGAGGPGGGRGGPGGRGGFDPEAQKKRQGLQKEAMDNVLKVLDDTQKGAVKDLTGAAFELRFEGFGAGGGFGGGAGGFGGGGFGGGFGGFPQPGQILAPFLQNQLKLSDDQKKQLEDLQKDVDAKLEKLLTEDQRKQLKDMREGAGRGGFGGRGGPGGGPPPGN